jgi:hypothetical protein
MSRRTANYFIGKARRLADEETEFFGELLTALSEGSLTARSAAKALAILGHPHHNIAGKLE